MEIFKELPKELVLNIFTFVTKKPIEKYWKFLYKKKFTRLVLSKINLKFYYTKFILPEINKGWKLVGINTYIFCNYCLPSREVSEGCCNCNIQIPCSNCYYYDPCSFEVYCSDEFQLVSWKQMKGFLSDIGEYKNYEDFKQKNKFNFNY